MSYPHILFESFDPAFMESIGLGPEEIGKLNPQLIHVSITAFGSDGPKAG